jgi:hypothetical protein
VHRGVDRDATFSAVSGIDLWRRAYIALLRPLADGRATREMRDVILLTDRLKSAMPRMLSEHKALLPVVEDLGRAARAERHPEVNGFVEKLTAHAQTEEQVSYRAASCWVKPQIKVPALTQIWRRTATA